MAKIFTVQRIFSMIFMLGAIYQFRIAHKYKKEHVKKENEYISSYESSMIWNNYVTSFALLIVAILLFAVSFKH